MSRKVISACGLACSMAPLIATKIQERLNEEGMYDVDVVTAMVPELSSAVEGACCIVTTVTIYEDYGIPIVNAMEFIMGGDGQETLDQVMEILRRN